MVEPSRPEPAGPNPYRWMLLGCEVLTIAALVANLVAMAWALVLFVRLAGEATVKIPWLALQAPFATT